MGRFLPYQPDQAYLVPPSVKDELGADHLCFFIHQAVEHLELKSFEQEYGEEGGALYCPGLMLKVWLYGYALGSRRRGGWSSGSERIWGCAIWRGEHGRTTGRCRRFDGDTRGD